MSDKPTYENVTTGLKAEFRLRVGKANTASHLGSGKVDVLATPEMVRMMECAAVAAVDPFLPPGYRTVGIHLDVSHVAATPVGMETLATAELTEVDGRRLIFRLEAHDERELIGQGTHQRMIIDLQRFEVRLEAKRSS